MEIFGFGKLMTWGDSHWGAVQLQSNFRLPGRHSKAHFSHKDWEKRTSNRPLFFLGILTHIVIKNFLNPKGQQKVIICSQCLVILLKELILDIGGIAFGSVWNQVRLGSITHFFLNFTRQIHFLTYPLSLKSQSLEYK